MRMHVEVRGCLGAQCHDHTFPTVRCRDLHKLTTSLEGNPSPIYIFLSDFVASSNLRRRFSLSIKHHLCGIQAYSVAHPACACMSNCLRHNNIASHHHLDFQRHDPCIMMSSHVSGQLDHLGLLEQISWELTHMSIISLRHPNHPSILILCSIGLSHVHSKPFTTYVLDSGCIIQPPIHGLGRNTSTPVPPILSLEDHL